MSKQAVCIKINRTVKTGNERQVLPRAQCLVILQLHRNTNVFTLIFSPATTKAYITLIQLLDQSLLFMYLHIIIHFIPAK